MPEVEESERKEEIKNLMLEAARLGFEVGYLGHIEGIGWVKSRLKIIETHAGDLGVLDEMREKYSLSKELGKKRRLQMTPASDNDRPQRIATLDLEKLPSTLTLRTSGDNEQRIGGGSLRVPPADGISAMANIMKVAESSHWVMRQLDLAFCGIADLYDLIGRIKTEGSPESILAEGLEKLKMIGWVTDYNIEEVNAGMKTARISAVSAIPNQYGTSTDPVCINISLALESIAGKAFNSPVQAIEKRCMCQGDEKCGFVITPRREI